MFQKTSTFSTHFTYRLRSSSLSIIILDLCCRLCPITSVIYIDVYKSSYNIYIYICVDVCICMYIYISKWVHKNIHAAGCEQKLKNSSSYTKRIIFDFQFVLVFGLEQDVVVVVYRCTMYVYTHIHALCKHYVTI